MFDECKELKSIDFSKFDTSEITSVDYLFSNCQSLTSIDISTMNTNKVTYMSYTFRNCTSLQSIDTQYLNTNSIVTMSGTFFGCTSLESIDLDITSYKVSDIKDLFNGCSNLANVSLSLHQANDADRVFKGCNSLQYVDLSNFNGSAIKLYVSDDFFPKIEDAIIKYNSSIIGNLKNRIPSTWTKIDINNQSMII